MSGEASFITHLRAIATDPAARGLADDVAVLPVGDGQLVLTHDMLVEGVHFLPTDPPESVAWKLVAVNLSDLAAKGAMPVGALMGYTLSGDSDWDVAFANGLRRALDRFGVPLLGGDTVSADQRMMGMTMIGRATDTVPSRSGARVGDGLFVTGVIGDGSAGLELARSPEANSNNVLVKAYRMPMPQLEAGQRLAETVTAMMDVSDGLLIDAARLAEASNVAVMIDLDVVPLSPAFRAARGEGRHQRLFAATGGDDYQLLFTSNRPLPSLPCPATRIGQIIPGHGVHVHDAQGGVPLPQKLGWEH